MIKKIWKIFTGVTAISQHIVNNIDYIYGSLLIHCIHDNTVMSGLARETTSYIFLDGYYCL